MISVIDNFYTIDEGMYQYHFFTLYEALLHLNGQSKDCLTLLN